MTWNTSSARHVYARHFLLTVLITRSVCLSVCLSVSEMGRMSDYDNECWTLGRMLYARMKRHLLLVSAPGGFTKKVISKLMLFIKLTLQGHYFEMGSFGFLERTWNLPTVIGAVCWTSQVCVVTRDASNVTLWHYDVMTLWRYDVMTLGRSRRFEQAQCSHHFILAYISK